MGKPHLKIGVIGGSEAPSHILALAEKVGREVARMGAVLVCGGLGGVMEAACRGAKQQGGITVGILPGAKREEANPYVDIPIVTGMSYARNIIVVRSSDIVIAVDGRYGTLSEIGYALGLGIPVVGIKTWDIEGVIQVETVEECMEEVRGILKDEKF